jgi:hypothetical protein
VTYDQLLGQENCVAKSPGATQIAETRDKLLYHWIKSNLFRVVHSDGA